MKNHSGIRLIAYWYVQSFGIPLVTDYSFQKRHDFTEKTIQYLNDLEFKKKWEFLHQYSGSSLNLMVSSPFKWVTIIKGSLAANQQGDVTLLCSLFFQRNYPPSQRPAILKNAKSNRSLVSVKEETRERYENIFKDKYHAAKTKSVRSWGRPKNSFLKIVVSLANSR